MYRMSARHNLFLHGGIYTSDATRRSVMKSTRIDWAAQAIDIGSFDNAASRSTTDVKTRLT